MKTHSIEFTEQQVKVLVELINIAVKTVGLDAAEPAVDLVRTIQQAVLPAAKTSPADLSTVK